MQSIMSETLFPANPVLLVDDEQQTLNSLKQALLIEGINNIIAFQDSREVLPFLAGREAELMLLDLTMPGVSGEDILQALSRDFPAVPVIILTGAHDVETAVRCLKLGAFDYQLKPVERGRLIASVRHALSLRELRRENNLLRQRIFPVQLENPEVFASIVTNNENMFAVFQYCETIAVTSLPVLITGETGTGKELLAQAIHRLSGRSGQFVPVNAAGLDDTVFSDTLFGHRKGAFTGAHETRQGLIELASGGSLFLDEIGDLSPQSQIKLLRLLQDRRYFPLGSDTYRETNARILTATNLDIQALQKSGSFRRDLFFRLSYHHIHLPPLRERLDDLPLLCEHFFEKASRELGKKPPEKEILLSLLADYEFPGNIRELESIVMDFVSRGNCDGLNGLLQKKAAALADKGWRQSSRSASSETPKLIFIPGHLPTLQQANNLLIEEALRRTGQNQSLAARMLGISRQKVMRYLKKR